MAYGIWHSLWRFVRFSTPNKGEFKNAINIFGVFFGVSFFSEKVFDMDFFAFFLNRVFELPSPRNAQKRTEKKK
jgi:hypothetical protein